MGSRKGSVGATLGTTLMVLALVVLMTFTLVGVATNHLNLTRRASNLRHARSLAESVVAAGISRVFDGSDTSYGAAKTETLEIRLPGTPGEGLGRLTFDPDSGVYSTNNLQGDGSVRGWNGTAVPGGSLHLVGVGECRGAVRTVEVLIQVPTFRYAVASSGSFHTRGELLVAGVASESSVSAGVDRLSEEELLPGHLTVSGTAAEAIVFEGDTRITGDVQSSGGARFDPQTEILGELRLHAQPEDLPRYDLSSYDPQLLGKGQVQYLTQSWMRAPIFEGYVRREGELQVLGGMTLDGAVLFVDGDLTVEGGLHGRGAVVVTGRTTILGGSSLSSDSQAALFSAGDVVLDGYGKKGSYFQGLIYTEGNLEARQLTVMGTLIANKDPALGGSSVLLEDAAMVHVPEYADLAFQEPAPQPTAERSRSRHRWWWNHDDDEDDDHHDDEGHDRVPGQGQGSSRRPPVRSPSVAPGESASEGQTSRFLRPQERARVLLWRDQ
ncbi:MAG: hypothetical protein HY319_17555 [Armatimonadetes bacterium]|nr:hypothetical protein [Armatimonadota bacterium]